MSRAEENLPEYKSLRLRTFARDKFTCQKCQQKGKLEAHHIKKWADYPALRYVASNWITLCKRCHDSIWGKEEQFEAEFKAIVAQKLTDMRGGRAVPGFRKRKYIPRNPKLRYF